MDDMLVEACHKLSEVEDWVMLVAQDGVEAYKASNKCHNETIKYSTMTYPVGKEEVRSMVVIHFSSLDLTFLDVESEEDDEPTPKLRANADSPTTADPPSAA